MKTNWEQIKKRAEDSKKALDYMTEHPLTHEEAIEQSKKLKNMVLEDEIKRYTEKYIGSKEN